MRDMKSFYKYLDTCFFQTTQMRNNSRLLLKSSDDPLILAHNCSIIDKRFRDEHTNPPRHMSLEKRGVKRSITSDIQPSSKAYQVFKSILNLGRRSSKQVDLNQMLNYEA